MMSLLWFWLVSVCENLIARLETVCEKKWSLSTYTLSRTSLLKLKTISNIYSSGASAVLCTEENVSFQSKRKNEQHKNIE